MSSFPITTMKSIFIPVLLQLACNMYYEVPLEASGLSMAITFGICWIWKVRYNYWVKECDKIRNSMRQMYTKKELDKIRDDLKAKEDELQAIKALYDKADDDLVKATDEVKSQQHIIQMLRSDIEKYRHDIEIGREKIQADGRLMAKHVAEIESYALQAKFYLEQGEAVGAKNATLNAEIEDLHNTISALRSELRYSVGAAGVQPERHNSGFRLGGAMFGRPMAAESVPLQSGEMAPEFRFGSTFGRGHAAVAHHSEEHDPEIRFSDAAMFGRGHALVSQEGSQSEEDDPEMRFGGAMFGSYMYRDRRN